MIKSFGWSALVVSLMFITSSCGQSSAPEQGDVAQEDTTAVSATEAPTAFSFSSYQNARFDYAIAYPPALLIPQGEAQNGDGQCFQAQDSSIVLLVYGRHYLEEEPLAQIYAEQQEGLTPVTYKVLRDSFFVVSGVQQGRVYYEKTVLRNEMLKTMQMTYPATLQDSLDAVVTRIATSFEG